MNIYNIPNEIIEHILSFTGKYSGIVARTCILWNDLVEDHKISVDVFTNLYLAIWGRRNIHNFWERREEICEAVAKNAYCEIIEWRNNNKVEKIPSDWNIWLDINGARHGHIDLLDWLLSPGHINKQCSCNKWICEYKIAGEHLKILKWMRSRQDQEMIQKELYRRETIGF